MSTIVSSLCVLFLVILSIPVESTIDTSKCGEVKLRSEKVVNFGNVEIEYRPSNNEKSNNNSKRHWKYSTKQYSIELEMTTGMYEQIRETSDVYVLKIYRFNISMNGRYAVYCGDSKTFTNTIELKVSELPSGPVIVGLQDIENCRDCIVAEDNEKIALACVIHGVTPPLTVTMTIGNETYSPQNKSNPTTFIVFFTVRDHHHMKNVIFSVMNDALSSPLKATAQMFVIKPPVIGFNISGSTLDISEGERAHVKCEADSVPVSNISWIEELSNENITKKQCNLTPNCVLNIDTDEVSNRRFKCQVHYKTKVYHKYLTIHIKDKVDEDDKYNNKQGTTGQTSDNLIIWIILGACVLLVVIIAIAVLFIVFRKKGQTLEDKREGRVHHHTQEGHTRCTIQKSEDRPAGNQNEHALDNEAKENRQEGNLKQSGNRTHDDDDVPIYSQPVKKKTTENPDNIYAQVNKTRKSASSPSSANSLKVEKDGQLLYADLAFDPNAAPSKAAVAKQEDSPTEYVDIDYVKTKANKEIDDDPTEQENL